LADGEEDIEFGEPDVDEGGDGGLSGEGVIFVGGVADRGFELPDGGGEAGLKGGAGTEEVLVLFHGGEGGTVDAGEGGLNVGGDGGRDAEIREFEADGLY